MNSSAWDRRIARAEKLASSHTAAADVLRFYANITQFQKDVWSALIGCPGRPAPAAALTPFFRPLLSLVKRIGPPPLAQAADTLANSQLQDLIGAWHDADCDEAAAFFARALLQPYMELLARQRDIAVGNSPSICPFCGEKPQVGVLREEGEGAKRSLICSLCSTEWDYRRLVCPGCGEEAVDKLGVYTASEFDYVRVEACESCKTYIKSVDLTKNGLAVPVVDELATIPLNLWAEENGYRKLQLNLLGM
jgi:FdhE protein